MTADLNHYPLFRPSPVTLFVGTPRASGRVVAKDVPQVVTTEIGNTLVAVGTL